MLCAPLAGLVVGAVAAAAGLLLLFLGSGAALAAVASVAVPAALTRGLHLDGLADTADGLGSRKPAEDALRIMKQSDIGPFGVITLVLVLAAQTAALARAYDDSWTRGALTAVVAGGVARLVMTLAACPAVPSARPEGLGGADGAVPPPAPAALAALAAAAASAAAGAGLRRLLDAGRARGGRRGGRGPAGDDPGRLPGRAVRPPGGAGRGGRGGRADGRRGRGRAGGDRRGGRGGGPAAGVGRPGPRGGGGRPVRRRRRPAAAALRAPLRRRHRGRVRRPRGDRGDDGARRR